MKLPRLLAVAIPVTMVAVMGCQTTAKPPPVLPEIVTPFFGTCAVDDGAATLQLLEAGALAGSAEIEWVSKSRDHWDVEVTNQAGGTLLTASRHGLFLELKGPLSVRVPPMTITIEDDLLVDETFSGLKAREMICLLSGHLPYEWLSDLTAVDRQKDRTKLTFRDGSRLIETDLDMVPDADPVICTVITWRHLWLFSHRIHWCLSEKNQRVSTLEGWKDYHLKWVRIE